MIRVYDDFLFYADRVRNKALGLQFNEILGFKGIAPVAGNDWFVNAIEANMGLPIKINHSFFRKSPHGQIEPNYIHTDADMGMYTAILYLNYTHPEEDGTLFWRNRSSNSLVGDVTSEEGKRAEEWELIKRVPMRFNRALIFDSRLFHSRGLELNFGEGEGARLIQTVFFSL